MHFRVEFSCQLGGPVQQVRCLMDLSASVTTEKDQMKLLIGEQQRRVNAE